MGFISHLEPNEVIVVGTNDQGHHGAGAAAYAHRHFGLEWNVAEGLSGQSYALPTMSGLEAMKKAVARFKVFASNNPTMTFLLTRVGCGIAGFADAEVAPLFANAPENVVLPDEWK